MALCARDLVVRFQSGLRTGPAPALGQPWLGILPSRWAARHPPRLQGSGQGDPEGSEIVQRQPEPALQGTGAEGEVESEAGGDFLPAQQGEGRGFGCVVEGDLTGSLDSEEASHGREILGG